MPIHTAVDSVLEQAGGRLYALPFCPFQKFFSLLRQILEALHADSGAV
ncbi:MAG: hypothetical protein ACHBNF_12555 [Chromatiales bacterium]